MARFRSAHPQVDLQLHTSASMVDFVREDFHLAIRFGTGGWTNVHVREAARRVAAAGLLAGTSQKYGPVRNVDDLRRYPLLHGMGEPWTAWLFDGRADDPSSMVRGAMYEDSAGGGAPGRAGRWAGAEPVVPGGG